MTIKLLYCSTCQKPVKPVKSLVTYHCPKCGATFMASQVEREESALEDAETPEAVPRG